MNKGEMLYEGKAKQVFATENPEEVIVKFKDDATAFNAQKRGSFDLKGEMNNAITTLIFEYLQEKGIPTHFIKQFFHSTLKIVIQKQWLGLIIIKLILVL